MAVYPLRYYRNNTLRVACPSQATIIDCKGDATEASEGGLGGALFHTIKTVLHWRVKTVETTDRSYGKCFENGTCFGGLSIFSENKADVSPVPMPMIFSEFKPVTEGPAVGSFSHHILSRYTLQHNEVSFLSSLEVFSPDIWALILDYVVLISLVLYFTLIPLPLSSFLTIFWQMIRYIPGQGNYSPSTLTAKILVLINSLGCFILINYFGNMMSTEKISLDYSVLDMNLNDVYKHGKYPILLNVDSAADLVFRKATDPDTVEYKLWKRALDVGLEKSILVIDAENPMSFIDKAFGDNSACISFKVIIEPMAGMRCKGKPEEKLWLSTRETGSFTVFFLKRKNLSREANAALDDISYRVIESGLVVSMIGKAQDKVRSQFDLLYRNPCLSQTLAEVGAEIDTMPESISLVQISPLFLCLLVAIIFCGIALAAEMVFRHISSGTRRSLKNKLSVVGQNAANKIQPKDETAPYSGLNTTLVLEDFPY